MPRLSRVVIVLLSALGWLAAAGFAILLTLPLHPDWPAPHFGPHLAGRDAMVRRTMTMLAMLGIGTAGCALVIFGRLVRMKRCHQWRSIMRWASRCLGAPARRRRCCSAPTRSSLVIWPS